MIPVSLATKQIEVAIPEPGEAAPLAGHQPVDGLDLTQNRRIHQLTLTASTATGVREFVKLIGAEAEES